MSSPLLNRGRGAYRAFTLVELLTVIAIIGVLSAITFGVAKGVAERGRISLAQAELATLATALEAYKQHFGDYPRLSNADSAPNQLDPQASGFSPASGDRAYKFFRALNGRIAPDQSVLQRQLNLVGLMANKYGRSFVSPLDFELERAHNNDAPTGNLPLPEPSATRDGNDPDFSNAFLDPWGNRYQYYYRTINAPAAWTAPRYLLFSAGPDKLAAPPNAAGEVSADPTNADNINANF